jgi:hypothetical protein
MMRMTSGMSNRIQGMYGNRRGIATTGRKILGVARSGISMLGRANAFANKMGINNPAVNSAVGAMQQYGNPMLNYADNELKRIAN